MMLLYNFMLNLIFSRGDNTHIHVNRFISYFFIFLVMCVPFFLVYLQLRAMLKINIMWIDLEEFIHPFFVD